MAIEVDCRSRDGGWVCTVRVDGGGGETTHVVTVAQDDLARLDPTASAPERLVATSFEFLLERESNAAILRRFALPEIGRYFPGYEAEIVARVARVAADEAM